MSDMLRITGLVSGMDTETTVKKLIEVEQMKVDKAEQEKQYLVWQQEDYREVANVLRGFQDEYFDILKPATNMRSASAFSLFAGETTIGGVSSSAVSIKTTASSIVGSFSIDSVTQLATKDKYASASEVLGDITTGNMGDEATAIAAIKAQLGVDSTLSFTLDGVTKTISFDPTEYDDPGEMDTFEQYASLLSTKLQEAFSNVDITAEVTGDVMSFRIYEDGYDPLVDLGPPSDYYETGHTLTLANDNADLLSIMKLSEGQSNTVNVSKSLSDVFGVSTTSSMSINGVSFSFSPDTTVSEVMSQINSSSAGVSISYDTFSDKFMMESTSVGTDGTIAITDTTGLLSAFKLQGDVDHTAAQNAEFVVNGVSTTRSSNTFTLNGTEITLNAIPTAAVDINVSTDTTDVKDLIVKFVDAYNEMLTKINDMVTESRNYDYDPLTDTQKESMSDDDIEKWQAEARKGTLRNDTSLSSLTSSLREAMYESVEGLGISLYEIGIQSSSNYKEGGKLIIDETKLDAALEERPNEIIALFTQESDITYTSYSDRSTRYSENGLSARIYDILQDNIRLTRDDNGNKGYLIDKAGLDTGIDTTSDMAKKIAAMDSKIDDLLEMLADQEDKYYTQFAAMESAMSQFQSQSSWLTSQFGG
ncbi:MAG: flagellar filament capping protein FliD [Clostridia bacterium]|nr:flagellar filament capping protein FliD [Clostridia bacterium]